MNRMRLSAAYFIIKSWWKSFHNWNVYKRVGFKFIFATISRQNTELSYKPFFQSNWMWKVNRIAPLEISYPPIHQNITEEKVMFFDIKLSNSSELYPLEHGLYLSITVIVEAMNTLIQESHNHSESFITVKVSRRALKSFTLQSKGLVLHSLVQTWDNFSEAMMLTNLEWC